MSETFETALTSTEEQFIHFMHVKLWISYMNVAILKTITINVKTNKLEGDSIVPTQVDLVVLELYLCGYPFILKSCLFALGIGSNRKCPLIIFLSEVLNFFY